RTPSRSSHTSGRPIGGVWVVVESSGSCPLIALSRRLASSTVAPKIDTESSDEPKATSPLRLTRPELGFTPTTPPKAAGWRTEPPVSDPSATRTAPLATSAAEPPDDPPGTRVASNGWRTRPKAECSVEEPMANSSMLVLHATMAPAARSRSITVALQGDMYPSSMRDAQVVGRSVVRMLSLTATAYP